MIDCSVCYTEFNFTLIVLKNKHLNGNTWIFQRKIHTSINSINKKDEDNCYTYFINVIF